jgi:ribonuclease-3
MTSVAKGQTIPPERLSSLEEFEKRIGIWFSDPSLLNTALTHSSHSIASNERLEFLGDSIVDMVVGEYVYKTRTHGSEGELTNSRSDLVREEALAEAARGIDLGSYLSLGEGETKSGGAGKDSILSDAYEALVAAIYLEEGLEEARDFIHETLIRRESHIPREENYKSMLQEAVTGGGKGNPNYRVVWEEGPDHLKTFTVEVSVDGKVVGKGHGKSKKIAEQRAAKEAVRSLKSFKDKGSSRKRKPRKGPTPKECEAGEE